MLLALACASWAQAPGPRPAAAAVPVSAQVLAPGDLISVTVFHTPELATEARLAGDGSFSMPEAGTVRLAGKTAAQAAAVLAARLRTSYLLDPQVVVAVRAFAPEPVTVSGAVAAPGVYSARAYPDLAAMLAAAGGVRTPAGERIVVEAPGGGAPVVLPVESLARGRPVPSLPLHAGDLVRVLPAATVYVGGDVAKPGAYVLPSSGLTLLEALSLAGGVRRDSQSSRVRIVHRQASGAMHTEFLDARPIMRGRAPDPVLQAFDLVYVPVSLGRATFYQGMKTVVATASAIVSGIIIWH